MARSERLIVEMFAAIDGRCWEQLERYFAPDVIYERPGYEPIRGFAALDHFYRDVRIVAAGRHQLEQVVMAGHTAACWGRFLGTSRDGRQLDERFADIYEFTHGVISRRATYFYRAAI